jgi:hypothetical protein
MNHCVALSLLQIPAASKLGGCRNASAGGSPLTGHWISVSMGFLKAKRDTSLYCGKDVYKAPFSFLTADFLNGRASDGRIHVAPHDLPVDAQSIHGRRSNTPEFPIDRCRLPRETAPDAMVIVSRGGPIVLLKMRTEKQC